MLMLLAPHPLLRPISGSNTSSYRYPTQKNAENATWEKLYCKRTRAKLDKTDPRGPEPLQSSSQERQMTFSRKGLFSLFDLFEFHPNLDEIGNFECLLVMS